MRLQKRQGYPGNGAERQHGENSGSQARAGRRPRKRCLDPGQGLPLIVKRGAVALIDFLDHRKQTAVPSTLDLLNVLDDISGGRRGVDKRMARPGAEHDFIAGSSLLCSRSQFFSVAPVEVASLNDLCQICDSDIAMAASSTSSGYSVVQPAYGRDSRRQNPAIGYRLAKRQDLENATKSKLVDVAVQVLSQFLASFRKLDGECGRQVMYRDLPIARVPCHGPGLLEKMLNFRRVERTTETRESSIQHVEYWLQIRRLVGDGG